MDLNGTGLVAAQAAERRINPFRPELRAAEGGRPNRIVGYALVFDKLSRNLGGFVERMAPTAFRSLQDKGWPDVVCRFNHSDSFILGTVQGGTVAIDVDGTGVLYDVIPPESRGDVLELVQRGDCRASSFAFRVPEGADEWEAWQGNTLRRTVNDLDLVDVAPVIIPAYPDATAAARSLDGAIISLASKFHADPLEIRSLLDDNKGVKLFKRSDRPSAPAATPATESLEGKEAPVSKTAAEMDQEARAKLTAKARKALPNSAFAYIDDEGVGHFPIHDANHVRNALARIAQGAKFGKEALPKVKAAAKKFGIDSDEQNSWLDILEEAREFPNWFWGLFTECEARMEAEEAEARTANTNSDSTAKDDEADAEADEDESGKGIEGEERSASKSSSKGDDASDSDDDDDDSKSDSKMSDGKGKKVGKGEKQLPAFLQKDTSQKRMSELLGKRYDPHYFSDEETEA